MPRDVIWQLSALIGPEHVGRATQALYQVCKGALSGSYSVSTCLLLLTYVHTNAVLMCQDLVYEASVNLAALSAVSDSEGDGAE